VRSEPDVGGSVPDVRTFRAGTWAAGGLRKTNIFLYQNFKTIFGQDKIFNFFEKSAETCENHGKCAENMRESRKMCEKCAEIPETP